MNERDDVKIRANYVLKGEGAHAHVNKLTKDCIEFFRINSYGTSDAINTCLNTIVTIAHNLELTREEMLYICESFRKGVEMMWREDE